MFLLRGFDVEQEYKKHLKGQYPTQIVANTTVHPVFIYKRRTGKYDITGRARRKKCYTCGRKVEGEPIGIPLTVASVNGVLNFEVEGCYCTYNCAAMMTRFLQSNDPGRYQSSYSYLRMLHHMEHPSEQFIPSTVLPITVLKRFGGFLDANAFHRLCRTERQCRQVSDRIELKRVGVQYCIE